MVETLSIIAAIINALSQVQYIVYLVRKKIVLNKVTWGISAVVMCLQASTYYEIVRSGNPWLASASIVVAVSFIFIFLYSFLRGRYAKLTVVDLISLFVGLVTILIWKGTGNPVIAHLFLQSAIVVSFLPTIVGLLQGRLREKPWPWFVGVISYAFVICAVYLQSGVTNWVAFVYPVVVGVVINGFTGLLAMGQDTGYVKKPVDI